MMTKRILPAALSLALVLSLAVPAFAGEESPFTDVSPDHWAVAYIRQASQDNIIQGMGDGTFAPDDALTAAQFAAIVTQAFYWRDFGRDPAEQWTVPGAGTENWYVFYKEAAEKAGLAEGTGIKDWNLPMTRYQMAQMLYNIAVDKEIKLTSPASLYTIPDLDQIPEQYREAVESVYSLKLLSGMDKRGTFAGEKTLTRAQAAVIYTKLESALAATQGSMERALDRAERALALEYLSYTFTRYPGKLGTAYYAAQHGTPHGGNSWLSYVSLDGTEQNIQDLLPEGYIYGSFWSLDPKEIQVDEAGEKLSFVTRVQKLADGSDTNVEKDWGNTRIVVNTVSGKMESMEPTGSSDLTEWKAFYEPGNPLTPTPELRMVLKNENYNGLDRPYIQDGGFPSSYMHVDINQNRLCVYHEAGLITDPDFPAGEYGKAYSALLELNLPSVSQENFSPVNTPEQREQAARYFQLLHNGIPVSGDLWWSQGNNHKDLNFTFDQPVELKYGDTLTLRVGLPQEGQA